MAEINAYLNFNGNTEEVFNFYRSVFGGEFTMLSRFKDTDPQGAMDASEREKIMHVRLPIGRSSVLMGSDNIESRGLSVAGSNFSIAVSPESEAEATQIFNGLAAGGQVTLPMHHAPWGAFFGMLTDKFGIAWMVNYEKNQA